MLRRSDRSYRLFPRRVCRAPALDRGTGLCGFGRALPIPARSRQQPGGILHWPDARGLSWRSCRMDRLYATVRHRLDGLRLWRKRTQRTDRHRTASWPQTGRGGDCGAGRLGYGAHAVPRSGAGFHRRPRDADRPVQRDIIRPDRGDPDGRHRGPVAVPVVASTIVGARCRTGFADGRARGAGRLLYPARRPSHPARARKLAGHSSLQPLSTVQARWCSAEAMSYCPCCAKRL